MSNSQKKYLTLLPQCIACYLTAYFDEKSPFQQVVHFEVFNVHKKSPTDLDPPGPNLLADMDPSSQIWTPFQTFLLSILCIIFGN